MQVSSLQGTCRTAGSFSQKCCLSAAWGSGLASKNLLSDMAEFLCGLEGWTKKEELEARPSPSSK